VSKKPSKIYLHHVANLRELEKAITQSARLARSEIASKDPQQSLRSLLRLNSFLIGAWAETRLKKLLHEESGFSSAEREVIEKKGTQLEQWQETIDLAFRKHHKVPKAPLDERSLGVAHAARRAALHDVLSNQLRIIIEIRNKLAHGQWVYPFNSEGTAVENEKYLLINQENIQSLGFKYQLISYMADAVHDLVVSPETFERDFERHFRCLFQARTNLTTKNYADYESSLIKKRERARIGKSGSPFTAGA